MLFEERFDGRDLRLERVAQNGGLPCDGCAAEEHHAGEHARQHDADQRKAERVWPAHHLLQKVRHGRKGDAEQDACEDEEQGGGVGPGEQQEGRKSDNADAAHRDRPG